MKAKFWKAQCLFDLNILEESKSEIDGLIEMGESALVKELKVNVEKGLKNQSAIQKIKMSILKRSDK